MSPLGEAGLCRLGECRGVPSGARPTACRRPLQQWRLRFLPILCCRGVQAVPPPDAGPAGALGGGGDWQGDAGSGLFWSQGYLWVRGFASSDEVAGLRSAMADMLASWQPPNRSAAREGAGGDAAVSSLRAAEGGNQEPDHSFMLESATKASFFLESGAVDHAAAVEAIRPGVPKWRAVRKVAHGLHLRDGPFRDFVQSPKLAQLVASLGWHQPRVAQMLYRLAPPLAPGVDRHQDSTTLYTEPPSCLGVWLSLEDANEANGCLRVRRGSHREPIRERLVRRNGTRSAGDGVGVRLTFKRLAEASTAPDAAFTPLETRSGDLVLMHGSLEHFSKAGLDPNRSRESLQIHVVEGGARWSPDNWLQYPPGLDFMPLAQPPAAAPPRPRSDL